jgi:hypothetical protein
MREVSNVVAGQSEHRHGSTECKAIGDPEMPFHIDFHFCVSRSNFTFWRPFNSQVRLHSTCKAALRIEKSISLQECFIGQILYFELSTIGQFTIMQTIPIIELGSSMFLISGKFDITCCSFEISWNTIVIRWNV